MRHLGAPLLASTVAMALAVPGFAGAADPVRGTTYSATGQQVTFHVSRDGKRAYGFRGVLNGTCPGKQDGTEVPALVRFPGFAGGAAKVSNGRFAYESKVVERDDDSLVASGSFAPGGLFSGKVGYSDAGRCGGSATFTATAQPRQAGTPRRAYGLTLGFNPRELYYAIGATSLAGGAIATAQTDDEGIQPGLLRRIDANGRSELLLRLRRERDRPGGIATLRDGSIVFSQPGRGRILKRSRKGKLSVAASGLTLPTQVAATPDGGFAYLDGGTISNDDFGTVTNGRAGRVAGGGKRTALGDFPSASGIAVQRDGAVLVSTAGQVKRIAPGGTVTVVAGSGTARFSGDNGPAVNAGMDPGALAVPPGGGFLLVDRTVGTVRQVSPSGRITTYAGGGETSSGVPGTQAAIDPSSIAVLGGGTVAAIGGGDVTVFAAPKSRRLLVGVPVRADEIAPLLRRRRPVPVSLTRRAKVTLRVERGSRVVAKVTRTLPAGTHRVRLPKAARGDLAITARRGRAVATY